MDSLSIGLFTYSTKPRGSVVHAAALADALAERGHEVTLYALDKDGQGFYRPLRARLTCIPAIPMQAGSDALIARRIAEVAEFVGRRALGHQLLHAQDCLVASGLLAVRDQLSGAKVVRTIHHVERFESAFLEACQERSILASDACLTVSRATQKEVDSRYRRPARLVTNGVDTARFRPLSAAAREAVRARLGIPARASVVLSVGGVEPRKNSIGMLAAFALLRREQKDLHWVVVGGASIFEHAAYGARFEAELARLPHDTRDAVLRLGVQPDAELPQLVGAADALLHTSLHEGFGLCVLEAMAAGTPVVVSRGPPFDEFVDDSCALRVPASDARAAAEALASVLAGGCGGRVAAARVRAESYSWQQSARGHELAYREILAATPV